MRVNINQSAVLLYLTVVFLVIDEYKGFILNPSFPTTLTNTNRIDKISFVNVFSPSSSSTKQRITTPAKHEHQLYSMMDGDTSDDVDWYDSYGGINHRRRAIVAGNWKLNPSTLSEAKSLIQLVASNFRQHRSISQQQEDSEVVIFPPFPFLGSALDLMEGTGVKIGAQNIGSEVKGAYTGEVSASMVRSMGCEYVMLGHSERRMLFDEKDDLINKKVHLCLEEAGLSVILCIGETEQEYEDELLPSVVDTQLRKGLRKVKVSDITEQRIVIAYEPVWAIGTGKVATPKQAQKAHEAVRRTLSNMFGSNAAQTVRIQYGGSVTPESMESLMSMPDIDGALVGGASLTADSFTRIFDGAITSSALHHPPPRELMARECVSTLNVLGESPVWSARDKTLYWISAPEEELWAWNLVDPPYRRLLGTTLGCVVLKQGPKGSVVVGGERAILSLTMSPTSDDFATGPHILCARPETALSTRPNDGRVDRQGRFVFGMYNNYHRAGSSLGENNAGLYRLNQNLELEQLLDYKYRVSNCICFPQSGNVIYFCDTPTRKVYAFDYPYHNGMLSNRRLIWTVPPSLPGGPDGAQVDAQGFLWIALSGAGKVVRIDPSLGTIDMLIHLPVKSPTSLTFGGDQLDELFITTRGPDGGGLYRVKMPFGIYGLPEPEFIVNA